MLEGKVALVTGASQGLGRALALAYAKEGANLVLSSRSADSLETVAEEARGSGVEVLAVPADLSHSEDVQKLVDAAVERFGKIDVLVNNAGLLGPRVTIEEYPKTSGAVCWKQISPVRSWYRRPRYRICERAPLSST